MSPDDSSSPREPQPHFASPLTPCPHALPDGRLLVNVLAEQGGIDHATVLTLSCADIELLVRTVARNNYLAHATADIIREVMPDEEPEPRPTSFTVAPSVLVVLLLLCAGLVIAAVVAIVGAMP